MSIVDVPGHERFLRTMVAGATGIDLFLMAVAADDGVMPQTREHAAVLAALGVSRGVVAITKADRIDPLLASAEAAELLPRVEIVACSARTGEGVDEVASAVERVAGEMRGRASEQRAAVLHIDRVFTIHDAGTVVTGTLWSGAVAHSDTLVLLPAAREVRVRTVHVHGEATERAEAGQRVALKLKADATVARLAKIPHGDAANLQGSVELLDRAPHTVPFPIGGTPPAPGSRSCSSRTGTSTCSSSTRRRCCWTLGTSWPHVSVGTLIKTF